MSGVSKLIFGVSVCVAIGMGGYFAVTLGYINLGDNKPKSVVELVGNIRPGELPIGELTISSIKKAENLVGKTVYVEARVVKVYDNVESGAVARMRDLGGRNEIDVCLDPRNKNNKKWIEYFRTCLDGRTVKMTAKIGFMRGNTTLFPIRTHN